MQFQLLINLEAVLLHLLLLLLGEVIILPLHSTALLHLVAAQPLTNLKNGSLGVTVETGKAAFEAGENQFRAERNRDLKRWVAFILFLALLFMVHGIQEGFHVDVVKAHPLLLS